MARHGAKDRRVVEIIETASSGRAGALWSFTLPSSSVFMAYALRWRLRGSNWRRLSAVGNEAFCCSFGASDSVGPRCAGCPMVLARRSEKKSSLLKKSAHSSRRRQRKEHQDVTNICCCQRSACGRVEASMREWELVLIGASRTLKQNGTRGEDNGLEALHL